MLCIVHFNYCMPVYDCITVFISQIGGIWFFEEIFVFSSPSLFWGGQTMLCIYGGCWVGDHFFASPQSMADLCFVLVQAGSLRCLPAHPPGTDSFCFFPSPRSTWGQEGGFSVSSWRQIRFAFSLPPLSLAVRVFVFSLLGVEGFVLYEGVMHICSVSCPSALYTQLLPACLSHWGGPCLICPQSFS